MRPTKTRLVAALVLLGAGSPHVHAQKALDYPQWRGQARDGSASGFSEPAAWPVALHRRWTVEVGEGYGTPLIVGETVYVFTRRDGEEVMTALDAATGRVRWRSGYPAPYVPSKPTVAHGTGPKATPLFQEGTLFTQGVSGIVSAFDAASGKRLWHTKEPAEHPFYSAASSPAGEGGMVVVHPGNYEPLTAFDATTGMVKWVAGPGGFFMSPLIVTLDGVRQVVTVTQSSVIGVSVSDGAVLWQYPWDGGGTGGTMPVAYDGTIIVAAGSGVRAFRPLRRKQTWVAETLWETKDVSMYLSNPVVIGDTLFGLSQRNSGQLFAIDARSGTVLWLGAPRAATNTAVVKSNDLLFLLNDDGELIVARASPRSFQPIARYTVSESATWAQPAISGNRIFVKDAGTLSLWTVN
jgi:outer membrane protein assembly factor BamB